MTPQPEADEGTIEFRCQACNNTLKTQAKFAGRTARCPQCEATVPVPGGLEVASRPGQRKGGRGVLLGLLALLLIAAGIGVALWLNRKSADSTIQATDINDLSLVPANAEGMVCVKMATVWQLPAVQKALLDRRTRDPGEVDLGQRMERETGLKPDDIERLTVVSTDVNKKEGWFVVKTKTPYDVKSLRARIKAPRSMSHLGRPYVVGQSAQGQPIAVAWVSPRVLVAGNEAGVRQALALIGSPVEKGPLAPAVALCDQDHHAVFGFNPASGVPMGKPVGIDTAALADVEVFLGMLNLREQAELEVRARTASKDKAEGLLGTVKGWVSTLHLGLAIAQFQRGEKGRQARQLNKLLGATKFAVEGNDVVGRMKTDPEDALNLLQTAAP